MPIRVYKPTTNGRRNMSVNLHAEVTKKRPEKSLLRPLKRSGGRNNQGKITVQGRGGGHKRRYRVIDFRRTKDDMPAKVVGVEYDPNRSCHIALLEYKDGTRRYILSPRVIADGDELFSSNDQIEPKPGNCMPLKHIPTGLTVHNVEFEPGKGGKTVPGRRRRRASDKQGRPLGHAGASVRRDQAGLAGVPRHDRRRSATPITRTSSSARPDGTAGAGVARRRAASPWSHALSPARRRRRSLQEQPRTRRAPPGTKSKGGRTRPARPLDRRPNPPPPQVQALRPAEALI